MQEVSIDAAIEFLHGHLSGYVKFDGERVAVKFIVASDGALVLPDVKVGMMDASATRNPAIPCTRSWESTTAIASAPILQVPTG